MSRGTTLLKVTKVTIPRANSSTQTMSKTDRNTDLQGTRQATAWYVLATCQTTHTERTLVTWCSIVFPSLWLRPQIASTQHILSSKRTFFWTFFLPEQVPSSAVTFSDHHLYLFISYLFFCSLLCVFCSLDLYLFWFSDNRGDKCKSVCSMFLRISRGIKYNSMVR